MTPTELKSLRSRLGLTQAALAEAVGVVPNTLAPLGTGRAPHPQVGGRAPGRGIPVRFVGERGDPSAWRRARSAPQRDPRPRWTVAWTRTVFEQFAADALKRDWPRLVPVAGGGDDGFDGAVADGDRRAPFPLVVTTAKYLTGNLRKNLARARRKEPAVDRALFATSRRVTPRMRQKLQAEAGKLGVTLLQIYDQDWFASCLYGSPEWCKRLLGVTARTHALSPFPFTQRPVLGDRVLGRDREMRWLQERSGDCLLVGAPGSGKTFLLRALVLQGQALFLVDDDREQLANDLRSLKPPAVIIDDAHVNPGPIERFAQLRTEVASGARIIATSWPGRADAVQRALQIPDSEVQALDAIDAGTMIKIIKSAGIAGPDELLYHIRLQAAGRPGLGATLSHMCQAGDVRRAASGEGLVDQLAPQLDRMLDVQDATRILAPFALGGDDGVRPEPVADRLRRPIDEISSHLAQLAAAGIVMERPHGAVSVEPALMRWVLVRRAFFSGAGSPEITPFLELVESQEDALHTLIGARARGAAVPDLEDRLQRADSGRLWAAYASVGPAEARHAIKRHPERVLEISEAALKNAPESMIPLLLDRLHDDWTRVSGSESPLQILSEWATGVLPDSEDSMRRRSILLATATNWWQERRDANNALRVMCIALQPGFGFFAPDPGSSRRGELIRGHLGDQDLVTLTTSWPRVMDVVRDSEDLPWDSLFQLVRAWRYVHPSSLAGVEIAASTADITRQFSDRMLRDLVDASRCNPGVQHALRDMSVRFGVEIQATTDRDFEDLYRSPHTVDDKMDDDLVKRWRHRTAVGIAKSLESRSARSGTRRHQISSMARAVPLRAPRRRSPRPRRRDRIVH